MQQLIPMWQLIATLCASMQLYQLHPTHAAMARATPHHIKLSNTAPVVSRLGHHITGFTACSATHHSA